jgi:hypothetical protein
MNFILSPKLASFGVLYICGTKCYSGGYFVQGKKRKAEDEGPTQQEVPESQKENDQKVSSGSREKVATVTKRMG